VLNNAALDFESDRINVAVASSLPRVPIPVD
jgi:hypothetical protein